MMTDTERAISFFENALENCVMVARKPFETALDALRRTAEDDKAREEGTWQNVYLSSPSSFVGTCSICGISNDIPPPVSAHYCPNCGAKMSDEAIWKALGGGEGGTNG